MTRKCLYLNLFLLSLSSFSFGQEQRKLAELRLQLQNLIVAHKGTVGIAIKNLEQGDTLNINDTCHYPMQSVYKFPLAMAVLHEVDGKKISLDQKIYVSKHDLHKTWSPIKEKYPKGNIELSIAALLAYSVSESDNNACDLLFKVMGGPARVNQYIANLGINGLSIAATEYQMHQRWEVQYTNWSTPSSMLQLLEDFYGKKHLSDSSSNFLMRLMTESLNSSKRIKGALPSSTIVAHKTGSSGTGKKGLIAATNDIGIITLPDGNHLAVVVYIKDAVESYDVNEQLIAAIARTTFDYFSSGKTTR